MVLQSEIATSVLDAMKDKTYTVEFGYSSTADYNDDSLDTIVVSAKFIDTVTFTDNIVTFSFQLGLSEGNDSVINSYLIKDNDGNAIKKDVFTAFTKTSNDIREFNAKITVLATV